MIRLRTSAVSISRDQPMPASSATCMVRSTSSGSISSGCLPLLQP
jgi:hypothetical protein